MTTPLLLLLCLSEPLVADADRPRHPLAPSLRQLTPAEEKRVEAVIERFIAYDTGKLPGAAGKKALADLNALGPDAFFVLLDGFNRAADMEASCPAVVLGRKLAALLRTTQDLELIAFARENVGAGVTAKRHRGTVEDLKLTCVLRRGELQRRGLTARAGPKAPAALTVPELVAAAGKASGPQLRALLAEAEKRPGPQVTLLLAQAAASEDPEASKLGRDLLRQRAERQPPDVLKALLKHDRAAVREAAARAAGAKQHRLGPELIARLDDADPAVQQAARQALVALAGVDHGPDPDASVADRQAAASRWRSWWADQAKR